jgi:hypothetical protein
MSFISFAINKKVSFFGVPQFIDIGIVFMYVVNIKTAFV